MSELNICYEKSPLKKVAVQLNFESRIDELIKDINENLITELKNKFPILEPQKFITKAFQILGNVDGNNTLMPEESVEWLFNNPNTGYALRISSNAIIMDTDDYQSYEEFKDTFKYVVDAFNKYYPKVLYSRFGLRYINEITIGSNRNPLEWTDYLTPSLTGVLNIANNEDKSLLRAICSAEIRSEGMNLKFQWGMHNPDYPSIIKKKIFVLDYDASITLIFNYTDIFTFIDTAHRIIQEQFESSITDRLRDVFIRKSNI